METKAGIKHLKVTDEGGKAVLITVDMGIPEVTGEVPEPITIDGRSYEFIGISMGNPHAIYYMDEIDGLDLEAMGPAFETHERFPERTNSEFIQVIDRSHLRMRVWERGSGETWACGTGATASAVASVLSGRLSRSSCAIFCTFLTVFTITPAQPPSASFRRSSAGSSGSVSVVSCTV